MGRGSHGRIDPDWSYLPDMPLETIAGGLITLSDFIRFRSVCQRWRSAAATNILCRSQPPLLLVEHDRDREDGATFLSPSTRKLIRPYVPELRGKIIISSAYGWLVVRDVCTHALSLINPLSRSQIALPPTSKFWAPKYAWNPFLSCSPSAGRKCMVMVLSCYEKEKLAAFCRLGDVSWSNFHTGLTTTPISIAYHKKKFYALDNQDRLSICKANKTIRSIMISDNLIDPGRVQMVFFGLIDGEIYYLKVDRIRFGTRITWNYAQVFKAYLNEPFKMSDVKSFPGKAFFFDGRDLFAVNVEGFNGWRENCIYSTYHFGCKRPENDDSISVVNFENDLFDLITWQESRNATKKMWLTPSFI